MNENKNKSRRTNDKRRWTKKLHRNIYIEMSTYRPENSSVNQITTTISILSRISIAWSSYSSIVQKTLKAKHVNTIQKLYRANRCHLPDKFVNYDRFFFANKIQQDRRPSSPDVELSEYAFTSTEQ